MKAVLSNKLWIPRKAIEPHHFDSYTYSLRDGRTGDGYKVETFDFDFETDQYAFPRGDLAKLAEVFGGAFEFEDARVTAPHGYKLRFSSSEKLRPDQLEPLLEWIKHGYGLVRAPARWGKTVWLAALLTKLKQRTLMMAHTIDLIQQLEETVRKFTNVNDLEEEHGIKLIGTLDNWKNKEPFPILTLSTYQKFAVSATGSKVIETWRDKFGLVMVDEAHRGHTDLYTGVVQELNALYRCGVTATPKRKDGLHVVVQDVIGPVVAVGEGEQLPVHWTWEETGIPIEPFSNWGTMWNRLVKRKRRTRKIAQKIVDDVLEVGHFVLVGTERLMHLEDLKDAIYDIDCDITVGVLSGRTKDRKSFREEIKCGEYQVVLAMNRIVQEGYNVPRWSCFHNVLPMANEGNWEQRISRIRTVMEPAFDGDDFIKPQPVARVWVDQNCRAINAYKGVVRRVNKRLGFTCLNPPKLKKQAGRQGFTKLFEEK